VPKFQKKPVVIEAWLWDETKATFEELKAAGMTCGHYDSHLTEDFVRNMRIQTLEGSMFADKGDMIIKGVKGEFYPCKPDIFEATYSPVAEVPVSNILGTGPDMLKVTLDSGHECYAEKRSLRTIDSGVKK